MALSKDCRELYFIMKEGEFMNRREAFKQWQIEDGKSPRTMESYSM